MSRIPPPPPGVTLDSPKIPPPPPGVTLDAAPAIPPPPPGVVLDRPAIPPPPPGVTLDPSPEAQTILARTPGLDAGGKAAVIAKYPPALPLLAGRTDVSGETFLPPPPPANPWDKPVYLDVPEGTPIDWQAQAQDEIRRTPGLDGAGKRAVVEKWQRQNQAPGIQPQTDGRSVVPHLLKGVIESADVAPHGLLGEAPVPTDAATLPDLPVGRGAANAIAGGAAGMAAAQLRTVTRDPSWTDAAQGYSSAFPHPNTLPYKIAGGAGSAAMMLPSIPLGFGGMYATGGVAGYGSGEMVLDQRRAAGEEVGPITNVALPLGYALAEGGAEAIGGRIATKVAPPLINQARGVLAKTAVAGGVNITGNVGEEVGTQIAQNLIQQGAAATGGVSGQAPGTFEGIGNAAAGGLGGGLVYTPLSLAQAYAENRQAAQTPSPAAPPPRPPETPTATPSPENATIPVDAGENQVQVGSSQPPVSGEATVQAGGGDVPSAGGQEGDSGVRGVPPVLRRDELVQGPRDELTIPPPPPGFTVDAPPQQPAPRPEARAAEPPSAPAPSEFPAPPPPADQQPQTPAPEQPAQGQGSQQPESPASPEVTGTQDQPATAKEPWESAREAVQPYAESLRGLSDKQLKAEEKRTADELNAWARRTPALLPDGTLNPSLRTQASFEFGERFNAVNSEIDRRKRGEENPPSAETQPPATVAPDEAAAPTQAEPAPVGESVAEDPAVVAAQPAAGGADAAVGSQAAEVERYASRTRLGSEPETLEGVYRDKAGNVLVRKEYRRGVRNIVIDPAGNAQDVGSGTKPAGFEPVGSQPPQPGQQPVDAVARAGDRPQGEAQQGGGKGVGAGLGQDAQSVPSDPVAYRRAAERAAAEGKPPPPLPPHLQALVKKMEATGWNERAAIRDVTPEGYGPVDGPGDGVTPQEWENQRTTEERKLVNTIQETQTRLRGKLSTEARTGLEGYLERKKTELAELEAKRGPRPLSASEIEHDRPVGPRSQAERYVAADPNLKRSWDTRRANLQARLNDGKSVSLPDLQKFAGEPWADAVIAKKKPARPTSPDGITARRKELHRQLKTVLIQEHGPAIGGNKNLVEKAFKNNQPDILISDADMMKLAESLPEGHAGKLLLHNLKEIEENPRGTKVQAFNTNDLPDGSAVVFNDTARPAVIDKELGEVRNDIKAELPPEGMTLYGKKVLPPEEGAGVEGDPFADVRDPVAAEGPQKAPAAFFDADAAGVTGEKPGLFGQATFDGATGRETPPLFHEPTQAIAAEVDRLRASKAALDPANTGEMFGEQPPIPDRDALEAMTPKQVAELAKANGVPLSSKAANIEGLGTVRAARNRMRPSGAVALPSLPPRTKTKGQTLELTDENTWDQIRRVVQDELLPVKRMQDDVRRQGGAITEDSDPYLKSELFRGRAATEIRAVEENVVKPIVGRMTKAGLTVADVDEYLYALHAPERNAQVAKVNPTKAGLYADGSGMSDADAARVVAKWTAAGKKADLDTIAAAVHKLNDDTLTRMVDAGLLEQSAADAMRQTYKQYVPLRTDMEAEGMPSTSQGKGFSIRGKEGQRATGRSSVADSPLTFSLMQAQEKIVRAERNRVGQAMLKLVEDNPDADLWTVNDQPTKTIIDPRTGMTRQQVDPLFQYADNVVPVKRAGKTHLIEFKHESGKKIAAAMKRLNYQDGGKIVQTLGRAMRGYAALQTTLNPDFIVPNLVRDVQAAAINLSAEQSKAMAARVVKGVPQAGKAFWDIQGDSKAKPGSAYHDYAREYLATGGKVDAYHVATYQQAGRSIERLLAKPGRLKGAARAAGNLIERVNSSIEQATRLSAYVEARKAGMSRERAASLAKNLTVNFERKGEAGTLINSLYLFANANIQGNARMIAALGKSKAGRRIAGGITASGLAYGLLAPLLFGQDEEGRDVWDTIPDGVKDTSFILPTGGGKYVKIPLPYGYSTLFTAGRLLAETATGRRSAPAAAGDLIATAWDAFNPLGREATPIQVLTPTVLDPFVQATENKDWAGRQIVPEQNPFGPPKPDSQLSRRDTSVYAKAIAQFLNVATGGDEVSSGKVDVSPATLDHYIDWATGGVGRFITKATQLPFRVAGDDLPPNTIPIVNRFIGEPPRSTNAREFYDIAKAGEDAASDLKHYEKSGQQQKADALRAGKGKDLEFRRWADRLRSDVKKLRDADKLDDANAKMSEFLKAYRTGELPDRWQFENELGEMRADKDAFNEAKKKRDTATARRLAQKHRGWNRLTTLERQADRVRKVEEQAEAGRITTEEAERRINMMLRGVVRKAG